MVRRSGSNLELVGYCQSSVCWVDDPKLLPLPSVNPLQIVAPRSPCTLKEQLQQETWSQYCTSSVEPHNRGPTCSRPVISRSVGSCNVRRVERTTVNDGSLQSERATSISRPLPHVEVHPPIQGIRGPSINPSKDSCTNCETLPVDLDVWKVVIRRDSTDAVVALGRRKPVGDPDRQPGGLAVLERGFIVFRFGDRIIGAGGIKGKVEA